MNDILNYNDKPIRLVLENGEELYNILDVLENGIGYKKPHNQLDKVNKAIEEQTGLSPNWGNKEFSSKKGDRTIKQPVLSYKQLIFFLQFINSSKMIPFKLWIAERISDDKDADIKGLFNSISLQPTTPYRQRIINQKKALGVPELEIDVRTYNAKLNTTLTNLIKEEGFGKGTIIQIQTTFGEVAYGMKPHIFRQENNITNPNITREYCSHEQNVCFQLMDQELYKRIIRHEGKLTQRILYRYVEDSTGVGISYIKSISGFKLYFSNDNGNQSSLDNYYEVIVKENS